MTAGDKGDETLQNSCCISHLELCESNRTTILLSCCDPSEMRAPLPSDSLSLEPLWVSLSAHSHSSIDGCFSSLSQRGHNLLSSNSSRKPTHKQLNTSHKQPAAPRVGGSLPCRSGEAGSAPTWADAGMNPCSSPGPCCTGRLCREQCGACSALAAW